MNLLDLYQYLKDRANLNVTFYCKAKRKLDEIVEKSLRSYSLLEVRTVYNIIFELPNVVITDFVSLARLHMAGIPIVCKKLVVMDNVELSYHLERMTDALYYIDVDLEKCLGFHRYETVEFLMPPINHREFIKRYPDIPARIFFKKINCDMLKTIKTSSNGKRFYRKDIVSREFPMAEELDDLTKMFEYDAYLYYKRKELEYFEQFGRLIFEFVMLGKDVDFGCDPNGMRTVDGFTDYLIHYGLDKRKLWNMMGARYEYKFWEL
jgi:hypothetical protein